MHIAYHSPLSKSRRNCFAKIVILLQQLSKEWFKVALFLALLRALHLRTHNFLRKSKPQHLIINEAFSLIFSKPAAIMAFPRLSSMDSKVIKKVQIPPSTNLIKVLSSSGYTIESALADIVDNSIAHNAGEIRIFFNRKGMESTVEILGCFFSKG